MLLSSRLTLVVAPGEQPCRGPRRRRQGAVRGGVAADGAMLFLGSGGDGQLRADRVPLDLSAWRGRLRRFQPAATTAEAWRPPAALSGASVSRSMVRRAGGVGLLQIARPCPQRADCGRRRRVPAEPGGGGGLRARGAASVADNSPRGRVYARGLARRCCRRRQPGNHADESGQRIPTQIGQC